MRSITFTRKQQKITINFKVKNQSFIVIRDCWPCFTLTVHKTSRFIESFGYCYHFYAGQK